MEAMEYLYKFESFTLNKSTLKIYHEGMLPLVSPSDQGTRSWSPIDREYISDENL
jgi:hypothetical protein